MSSKPDLFTYHGEWMLQDTSKGDVLIYEWTENHHYEQRTGMFAANPQHAREVIQAEKDSREKEAAYRKDHPPEFVE